MCESNYNAFEKYNDISFNYVDKKSISIIIETLYFTFEFIFIKKNKPLSMSPISMDYFKSPESNPAMSLTEKSLLSNPFNFDDISCIALPLLTE